MIGEAAVMVGVVMAATFGGAIGDDATLVNFGGNVVVLMVVPFLSTNYKNIKCDLFLVYVTTKLALIDRFFIFFVATTKKNGKKQSGNMRLCYYIN